MPDQRSALQLFQEQITAKSDATKVNIPDRGKYKGATFPVMSDEERKILFAMIDKMEIGKVRAGGPNIYYNDGSYWGGNAEVTKGEFLPSGTMYINDQYKPTSRAKTISHEMLHFGAKHGLNEDQKYWYDSTLDRDRSDGVLGQLFEKGSTEPLAYAMSSHKPDELMADTMFLKFSDDVKRGVENKNNPLPEAFRNFLSLIVEGH